MTVPPAVPSNVIGLTVKVRAEEPRSIAVPLIVEGPAALLEEAVTLPVRLRSVPTASVTGVAVVPPLLLNVTPANELVPNIVSVEPPLSTGALAALICPWPTVIVTVEALSVRPPAGMTTVPAALLRVSSAAFRTVPPV